MQNFELNSEFSKKDELDQNFPEGNFQMREIFEHAPQAVIVIDELQLIKEWNKKAEEVFGYTVEEVLDKPLSELIIPVQYRQAHKKGMQHFLKTGEGPVLNRTIQINGLNKLGKELPISLSISALKRNTSWLFIAFISDISESKQKEEEFLQQEAALHQSQLESKRNKDFLTLASHELKTPLTSIKALTQIALRGLEKQGEPETQLFLKKIEDQTNKVGKLINDLLDISRIQSGKLAIKKEAIELVPFVSSILDICQAVHPTHRIHATYNNSCTILLDPLRIEQVLTNLIGNAVKYSKGKDKVEVVVLTRENDVLFRVEDKGVGIDLKQQDKVFDKFYRVNELTKNDTTGLGIGLYISEEIVKLHGGEIWVESIQGEGSSFFFNLPNP